MSASGRSAGFANRPTTDISSHSGNLDAVRSSLLPSLAINIDGLSYGGETPTFIRGNHEALGSCRRDCGVAVRRRSACCSRCLDAKRRHNCGRANGYRLVTYDADTNTYSAINITSTGGVGPFTAIAAGPASSATNNYFIQTPAGVGQNGIVFVTSSKTNAGGTLTIITGAGAGGLYTCLGVCTSGALTAGRHITAGTIVGVAPAAVPTLSEWAMILFGLMLAGGAALYIQRRQMIA